MYRAATDSSVGATSCAAWLRSASLICAHTLLRRVMKLRWKGATLCRKQQSSGEHRQTTRDGEFQTVCRRPRAIAAICSSTGRYAINQHVETLNHNWLIGSLVTNVKGNVCRCCCPAS